MAAQEEETLFSHRRDRLALAAHRHAIALSTTATLRHPAGLQNDTMLLACSCVSVFIFTEQVLSFDSLPVLILVSVWFLEVQQVLSPSPDYPTNTE